MPAGKERASVESLRVALRRSVAVASLRSVAQDVGMSPTGLQNFLDGSEPYSATRRKLERWYVRRGEGSDAFSALAALEVLVQDLPPIDQLGAMEELVELLEDQRSRPPEWIVQVRGLLASVERS